MSVARERAITALSPGAAFDLWVDTPRWPTFVDGFGAVERVSDLWPEPGATVVWRSRPGGRGTVTETVVEVGRGARFVTEVFDDRSHGRQTVMFAADEGGCLVDAELDYSLDQRGPVMAVTDLLFVRRSMRDSIRRTLERFAVEAREEAALGGDSTRR